MEDSDAVFDRVLHSVGDDGKFQRRINIAFTVCFSILSAMTYMNILLAMAIPDHWCKVPGKENGNYSMEEWKNMTLPRSTESTGKETYSSCEMYNVTIIPELRVTQNETTNCQFGYEYDDSWFTKTVPSSQNWVCEKNLYTSNLFAASKLGEVFGILIFGYIGDTLGRRATYLIALTVMFVGRFASAFLVSWYPLFMAASIIASIPSTTAAQACLVIIMELSPSEDRAFLVQLNNIAWMTGLCLLPLFGWILGDAVILILVTTVPLLAYYPMTLYLVESPRWLLARGRVAECLHQLQIIAKVNGTRLSPDSALMLQNSFSTPEKVYGIASLFSSWRMGKNTCVGIICWSSCLLSYATLSLNITSMSGNPFLNFFLQSIAELPSYLVGKVLCDWLGRRFTGAVGFILSALAFIPVILMLDDPDTVWQQSISLLVGKAFITVSFFSSILQSFEIFPTAVRQSGISLATCCGTIFGILGPYVVFVGVTNNARFPYLIIIGLNIIGALAEIFLPETLHERLPETLQEAQIFGKDQDYWSIPRKHKDLYVLANLKMANTNRHLNSEHYDSEDN